MNDLVELKKQWSSKKVATETKCITAPKQINEILSVPTEIDGKKVVAIGSGAFSPQFNKVLSPTKMKALETVRCVIIPEGVILVDDDAFRCCIGLEQVEIPESVSQWGRQVFESCIRLKEVTLPSGTSRIPAGMFGNCSSLERIVIPETVTVIESGAFGFCNNLREIIISEEQMKRFGYQMLESSGILACFLKQVQKGKSDFGPEALSHIATYILEEKARQKALILSGNQAVLDAVLLRYKKLTLMRLDEYVEIAQQNNMHSVVAQLLQIKQDRFSKSAITEHTDKSMGIQERTRTEWKQIFRYSKKDGSLVISGYKGISPNLEIPMEMDGYYVTQIKDKAFRRSLSGQNETVELESVVIQPGVERIGKKAFANQRNLKRVHIPESVVFIAPDAFVDDDEWAPIADLVICASVGSYAETYAKENNIPFVAE